MLTNKLLMYAVPVKSIERQYQVFLEDYINQGPVSLGPLYSSMWKNDPKKFVITLSRYKFAIPPVNETAKFTYVRLPRLFRIPE